MPIAEKALAIRESLILYVNKVSAKEVKNPGTVSYQVVKDFCNDQVAVAKLNAFLSSARQVSPFLVRYQTDKPMVPFLAEDLFSLLRGIMQKFIKGSMLDCMSKKRNW